MINIADQVNIVRQQIAKIAQQSGRPSNAVTLLAVSKTRSAEAIRQAHKAGITSVGENYLQEALEKQVQLQDLPLEWHFIGPIQSNKTRQLASNFSWVQTLERLKIATRLNEQRPEQLPPLNVCVQVNISQDPNKAGVAPKAVLGFVETLNNYPRLRFRGLMTIPAQTLEAQQLREQFLSMQRLFEQLQSRYPNCDTLSMGMSQDMTTAIECGSTMVRIGTALFGPRN